jgi:hypothetical protein
MKKALIEAKRFAERRSFRTQPAEIRRMQRIA